MNPAVILVLVLQGTEILQTYYTNAFASVGCYEADGKKKIKGPCSAPDPTLKS